MNDICLNVEPFRQLTKKRNPGGDCFACAITATVRHFFPERPISFDDAWELFIVDTHGGGTTLSNGWHTLVNKVVWKLRELDYDLEDRIDIIYPTFDMRHHSHCWWRPDAVAADWSYRLEAWLSAGWLALAEMNFNGDGPVTPTGLKNHNDHFVVLDGQRHFWAPHEKIEGAHYLDHETHVVCSAKGPYWITTSKLLDRHGVAGLCLIRPDMRDRRG